jgi:precorrin-4 methylase
VAVVPQLTLPQGQASVVGVRLEQPAISRTLAILRRSGRSLSPPAAAFMHLLTQASRGTMKSLRKR